MAKKGFIIESMVAATDVVAFNRYCIAEADIDGGNLIALTAPTTQGDDVWTASEPAVGALGGLWIAYNPSLHITEVGDGEYAGLTADPRDYTNVTGKVFSAFKPQIGDIFVLSKECVDASVSSAVAGDFLESKASQSTWQRIAKNTGATAGSTAVQIMHKVNIPFPATKGTIGMTKQEGFKVEVVQ